MERIVLTLHELGLHKNINEYSNSFYHHHKRKKKKHAKKAALPHDKIIPQLTEETPKESKSKLKLRLKDRSIIIMR